MVLEISGLRAGYGPVEVLRGLDMAVGAGEIVAVLGANGVGKTTLNKVLSGVLPASAGSIRFGGREIARATPDAIVNAGLIHVPEGRKIFPNMSVRENLELGSYRRGKANRRANLERIFETFPRLRERSRQFAGTLSGGEQQMLAIARAMLARPRLILMDEPSMGLAPKIVNEVFGVIDEVLSGGTTVLLVEQNARRALQAAQEGHILQNGEIVRSGPSETLLADDDIIQAYLGTGRAKG